MCGCVLAGGQGAVVQPVHHDAGHNGGLPQAERHPLPSPGWQYTGHGQVSTLHSAFVYCHATVTLELTYTIIIVMTPSGQSVSFFCFLLFFCRVHEKTFLSVEQQYQHPFTC